MKEDAYDIYVAVVLFDEILWKFSTKPRLINTQIYDLHAWTGIPADHVIWIWIIPSLLQKIMM